MKKFFIVVGVFVFFSSSLFAGIAKIVAARGDVFVTRSGKLIGVKTGFEMERKDVVNTKANAKAQILFNDKTVITIGKNSAFKIDEYLYQEGGAESKASFSITKGAFRTITGKIGKLAPENFKLATRTATIGIRGTQILGHIGEEDKIACTDGQITVTSATGDTVVVDAGQITTVEPGAAPTPPRAYKPAEINQLGAASGGGGERMESDEVIDENADDQGDAAGTTEEPAAEEEEFAPEPEAEAEEVAVEEVFDVPDVDVDALADIVENVVENVDTAEEVAEVIDTVETVVEEVVGEIDDPTDYLPSFAEHLNDQAVIMETDPYLSWGVWIEASDDPTNFQASDILDGWTAGDVTATSRVDEYIADTSGATYTYNGSVNGVIDTGSAQELANGSVNLTFDFHNSDITGGIDMASQNHAVDLTVDAATITGDGFSIDAFSGTLGDTGVASGSADGSFYGPNADAIGGTFAVDGADGITSAYGVFTGTK